MASVIARTRTQSQAFLFAGKSAAAPTIGAVPRRLFGGARKEQLRVTFFNSLLFLADIALIALAFLGAGAICPRIPV